MDSRNEVTVGTWNTEWAPADGARGTLVRERLAAANADVLVVTEGRRGVLPDGGYVVDGGGDWGYGQQRDRRKVMLWSCWPLTDIECVTTGGGAGRVVSALTASPAGTIRILSPGTSISAFPGEGSRSVSRPGSPRSWTDGSSTPPAT